MDFPELRGSDTVAALVELGRRRGIPAGRCLDGSGIPAERLTDFSREIGIGQELAVIRNMIRLLPELPHLGLLVGRRQHLNSHGFWGLGLASCETLQEAVFYCERTFPVSSYLCRRRFVYTERTVTMVFDSRHLPSDLRRFAIDRDLAMTGTLHRQILGRELVPLAVRVEHAAPGYRGLYPHHVLARPEFAAASTEVVVDSAALDRPLAFPDRRTRRRCEAYCTEVMRRRTQPSLVVAVRDHIRANLAEASLEAAAGAVRMSSRTLRRRLAEHGLTFRGLLDEAREARARDLLHRGVPTVEVASRVGYTEPSAFIHAFRRWTGTTPGRAQTLP